MTAAADPDRAALLQQFSPMTAASATADAPPAMVDAASGAALGAAGPPGFSAAVLPLLASAGAGGALRAQQERLRAHPPAADAYYDQALALFGLGWQEGRYAFAADGSLAPAAVPCATGDAPQ
jgi:endoglucanase